ncbi:tripartite tricarboxylate transporter substrate binding protein [Achromobacter sp. Bel]|uniref:Bug family tripartite tricarboxylate transporter substrate binding protein n=1 Tax=Achromobacter sp. Bel TaxID=2727415 RepID=UPI00145E6ECE|nr:tripartite tricarboxylate transporter substrate binding protein [Achromobacter sp. Bel]NMK48178.1 tripartite tricarboxylate transporter substrate binding protein [Achromobacter sp. Bel]
MGWSTHWRTAAKAGRWAGVAAAATLALSAAASAQQWPARPITLIVPFPPGGTTDLFARTIAQHMRPALGESIVVENKPGAAGNLGVAAAARAQPDGYTIVLGSVGTQTVNQFLYGNIGFDPATDLVPLGMIASTPNVMAVASGSPWRNLDDVMKAVKKDPGKYSYASPGIGSSVHLTGAYFESLAGLQMLHVPFKGSSAAIPAVIGGQVDILMDNLPSSMAALKPGGRLRGIAVTSAERSPAAPDLPTMAEAGLPGFEVTAWSGLYAPRGTPAPVVDKLIAAMKQALKSPELQQSLAQGGATPGNVFGPDLAAFEVKERGKWGALIKSRGIKAD